jgi:AmmeMemoRadiSam system protein A
MAPSCCIDLSKTERTQLLAIARGTIARGTIARGTILPRLRGDGPDSVDEHPGLTPALRAQRGVFVTLTQRSALRGCIGNTEADAPLATAVADSAYSAAFRDPRFPQLQVAELTATTIEISVLTPMEPLAVASRDALIAILQPGVDGLLLQDGRHRSTFLPKVWEQLPDPHEFIDQLLAKADLPSDHWSSSLRVHRYQTISFNDSDDPSP